MWQRRILLMALALMLSGCVGPDAGAPACVWDSSIWDSSCTLTS